MLLATRDLSPKTHAGTRTLLLQYFVTPTGLSREHATLYGALFEARQQADYITFVEMDDSMRPWIAQAEAFVAACAALAETEQE